MLQTRHQRIVLAQVSAGGFRSSLVRRVALYVTVAGALLAAAVFFYIRWQPTQEMHPIISFDDEFEKVRYNLNAYIVRYRHSLPTDDPAQIASMIFFCK